MRTIFPTLHSFRGVKPRPEKLLHGIFLAAFVVISSAACQTPRLFVERGDRGISGKAISEASIRTVAINSLALESDAVEIPLSGEADAVVLTRNSFKMNEQGYIVWRGSSKSDAHESATILGKDGNYRGILRTRKGNFIIRPLEQEHVLVEMALKGVRDCVQ